MAYVKNTWVDREGTTRYHETVDEDGALIFTPDYEKVTEIGTPVNADNMNHIEEGIEDHENRITVLEESGDASNFLTKSQITNCILEVPQNIKLELNNGILTLKKGSKVIMPNGVGVFDEVITTEEKILSITADGVYFLTLNSENNLAYNAVSRATSGTTAPTIAGYWYDTTENRVKYYNGSSFSSNYYSFPVAILSVANSVITSIDQIFNGLGYIGSTIFCDKGVKVLIPSGRNADGTLKNIEYTTNTVAISDRSVLNGENRAFLFNYMRNALEDKTYDEDNKTIADSGQYIYNPITNNIYNSGGASSRWVLCGFYTSVNGQITSFQPKLPFRAVDYNEFNKSINTLSKAYITETYSNGYSWYRIWSDKWCEQGGRVTLSSSSTTTVTLLKNYANIDYNLNLEIRQDGFTGDKWMPYINAEPTVSSFVVKNSTSSTTLLMWRACGYIS